MAKFFSRWKLDDIGPLHVRLSPENPWLPNGRFLLRVPIDLTKLDALALCIAEGLDDPDLHP